jgi:hypothetical protein
MLEKCAVYICTVSVKTKLVPAGRGSSDEPVEKTLDWERSLQLL